MKNQPTKEKVCAQCGGFMEWLDIIGARELDVFMLHQKCTLCAPQRAARANVCGGCAHYAPAGGLLTGHCTAPERYGAGVNAYCWCNHFTYHDQPNNKLRLGVSTETSPRPRRAKR